MSEIKKELVLIPKSENYIQHMLEVIMKLPRAEKFNAFRDVILGTCVKIITMHMILGTCVKIIPLSTFQKQV